MKAITKDDIADALHSREFPDFVIQAFNEMIAAPFKQNNITVYQDDVVKLIMQLGNCERQLVFDNKWLDIEHYYEKAGWLVVHNKPSYTDDWAAHYTFN